MLIKCYSITIFNSAGINSSEINVKYESGKKNINCNNYITLSFAASSSKMQMKIYIKKKRKERNKRRKKERKKKKWSEEKLMSFFPFLAFIKLVVKRALNNHKKTNKQTKKHVNVFLCLAVIGLLEKQCNYENETDLNGRYLGVN